MVLLAPALSAISALVASAQEWQGDLIRGRAVVVGAGEDGLRTACFSCHGTDGVGDSSGAFPRLTGQGAFYLYKQLRDYAAGARENPIMGPIAKLLTDAEMQDVAAFYAAQEAGYLVRPRDVDGQLLQRGAALSAVGSPEQGIPACVNCHGEAGTGMPPSFPYLAGQYANYTRITLEDWQQGRRHNDAQGVMADIAKKMTAEDVRGTAIYFESVRPEG
jgi:cytochrome c553